jgi:hypothetical protein
MVHRELVFFSSRSNWDSPTPSPAGECAPPLVPRGTHSLAGEVAGEGPNSDEGTDTVVLWYVVRTTGNRAESRERTRHNIHILQKKAEPQLPRKGRRYCLFICLTLEDLLCKVTRLTSPKGWGGGGVRGEGGGRRSKWHYLESIQREFRPYKREKSRKNIYIPLHSITGIKTPS